MLNMYLICSLSIDILLKKEKKNLLHKNIWCTHFHPQCADTKGAVLGTYKGRGHMTFDWQGRVFSDWSILLKHSAKGSWVPWIPCLLPFEACFRKIPSVPTWDYSHLQNQTWPPSDSLAPFALKNKERISFMLSFRQHHCTVLYLHPPFRPPLCQSSSYLCIYFLFPLPFLYLSLFHFLSLIWNWPAVIWPKYCLYGVKHYIINQLFFLLYRPCEHEFNALYIVHVFWLHIDVFDI